MALWACPASVAEEDTYGLRENYTREVMSVFSRLRATQEHLSFLRKHSLTLEVVSGGRLPEKAVAAYCGGSVYLNKDVLMGFAGELSARGVPRDSILEIVAWKTAPFIAHEIRHAITQYEARRKLHIPFLFPSQEGELLSFLDTLLVAQGSIAAQPQWWEESSVLESDAVVGSLLLAWKDGPRGLRKMVRRAYPEAASFISDPPERSLPPLEEWIAALERRLNGIRKCREDARTSKVHALTREYMEVCLSLVELEESIRKARKRIEGYERGALPDDSKDTGSMSERDTEQTLEILKRRRDLLQDSGKMEALRAFFRERLRRIDDAWRARRASKKRG